MEGYENGAVRKRHGKQTMREEKDTVRKRHSKRMTR